MNHAINALRTSAEIFERYAALHKAKGTPDGDAKADANREAAAMCRVALAAEYERETANELLVTQMRAERDAFCAELWKQKSNINAIFDTKVWAAVDHWQEKMR